MLNQPNRLICGLGFEQVVDEKREGAGGIDRVSIDVRIYVDVVPHITIEGNDDETFLRPGSI